MEWLADFAEWNLSVFALLLFLAAIVANRLGFFLGARRPARENEKAEGVGRVVTGLLTLLGFTLALTLSYSSARILERRAGMVAEANAIGTAWLRANAIGGPRAAAIAERLVRYGQLRREYVLASPTPESVQNIDRRSLALQNEIWEQFTAIVRERSDPVAVSLMNALNDTFDASAAERFAIETRFPPQLFWLLIGMSLLSLGTFGYHLGLMRQDIHLPMAILTAVYAAVIVIILDMNAPRVGVTRMSVAAYDWALLGMQGGQPQVLPASSRSKE